MKRDGAEGPSTSVDGVVCSSWTAGLGIPEVVRLDVETVDCIDVRERALALAVSAASSTMTDGTLPLV